MGQPRKPKNNPHHNSFGRDFKRLICRQVYDEFYAEGDADKAAGRPVNPLHDRATNNIPESQVGFIGYACGPLFTGEPPLLSLLSFCI